MDTVTIRELRNRGGEVVDQVAAGRRITVTRDGRPVAELSPIRSRGLSAAVLLDRWRHVPVVDAAALRRDVDRVIGPGQWPIPGGLLDTGGPSGLADAASKRTQAFAR